MDTVETLNQRLTEATNALTATRAELAEAKNAGTATSAELAQLKTSVAEATTLIATLRAEKKAAEDLAASIKAGIKPDNTVDVEKLVRETAEQTRSAVAGQFSEKLSELNLRLEKAEKERAQASLEAVRMREVQRAVTASGGNQALITELVRGSTEKEIQDSADRAINLVKTIIPPSTQQNRQPPNTPNGPVPNPDSSTDKDTTVAGALGNVRSMTREEFAKHRNALKAAVQGRYAGGNPLINS